MSGGQRSDKHGGSRLSQFTVLGVAGYVVLFAILAEGVTAVATCHPPRHELISLEGVVHEVRLGGQGRSTWLEIESGGEINRYSSYYGVIWPGMERIRIGEPVRVLAERNKLARRELAVSRQFYIWQLVHDGRVIVAYNDVLELVSERDLNAKRFVDGILGASILFLLVAYLRRALRMRRATR